MRFGKDKNHLADCKWLKVCGLEVTITWHPWSIAPVSKHCENSKGVKVLVPAWAPRTLGLSGCPAGILMFAKLATPWTSSRPSKSKSTRPAAALRESSTSISSSSKGSWEFSDGSSMESLISPVLALYRPGPNLSLMGSNIFSKNSRPVMDPNRFKVRHSTNSKMSKFSVHSSWQPHFMHMYLSMEVLPMPAGAWTVMMVGREGPWQGTAQHLPNISSIRTDSTAPAMSPAPLTGLVKYWMIFARSSMSSLAARLVFIWDMTNFWCKFLRLDCLRVSSLLLLLLPPPDLPRANWVPGSNQSQKWSENSILFYSSSKILYAFLLLPKQCSFCHFYVN